MTKAERFFMDAQRYLGAGDLERAFAWHLKSAEMGYAPAQSNVGYAYLHGKGVRQDHAKAVEWFEKAALQDNTPAMINLGYCYTRGYGVPEDKTQALDLFGRAAMLGDKQAEKLYERMTRELGGQSLDALAEMPAVPLVEEKDGDIRVEEEDIFTPAPARVNAPPNPEAKKHLRKLIGADWRWVPVAVGVTIPVLVIQQLFEERMPGFAQVLIWVVLLAGLMAVLVGLRGLPGYRNAEKCLRRLENLGLLDRAVEEIESGEVQSFGFSGCITEHFVYGNGAIFAIEDILWVYPQKDKKVIALKIASRANPPMTLSGALKIDRTGMLDKAIGELCARNPEILSGNTAANRKQYEARREK